MGDSSLAEQLANVKLKPSKNKTKDFSDPKLAGFITQDEIVKYQKCALQTNMEEWQMLLVDVTFPAIYCPLSHSDAEHFVKVFERHFQKLYDQQQFDQIRDRMNIWQNENSEEKLWFNDLRERLQQVIDQAFSDHDGFFAKTSSRSAKDACIFKQDFLEIYKNELSKLSGELQENVQITALLSAAFLALRVTCASDVLSLFAISERIYQDMLLALETHERSGCSIFTENIILSPFIPIDVDMEFRGFVFQRRLTCLSQYNYLIHSQRLCQWRDRIEEKIHLFYNQVVKEKLNNYKLNDFVIDFALTKGDDENVDTMRVWVIELNPFMETTDGALFSWQHERDLLEGRFDTNEKQILFRITEKPRQGSWSMLPLSLRQWVKKGEIS